MKAYLAGATRRAALGRQLLPCPRPFEPPCRGPPRSGRRRARWTRQRTVRLWTNAVCGLWSILAGGLPAAGARMSKAQLAMVKRVESAVAEFAQGPLPEPTGKRGAISAAVARLATSVARYDCDSATEAAGGPQAEAAARPLAQWGRAELLALPSAGGTVRVLDHLPRPTAELWRGVLRPGAEHPPRPVKPLFLFTLKEWRKALIRMAKAGMLALIHLEAVPRGASGEALRAGAFTVPKGSLQRLIIDRRPQNEVEYSLDDLLQAAGEPGLDLPAARQFLQLVLGPDQALRLNLLDASNYYYLLQLPADRVKYNAVGPPVPAAWFQNTPLQGEAAALNSEELQPCLTVLAMGDHNAVLVGCQVHEGVLGAGGALPEAGLMRGHAPLPEGNTKAGIVVDDYGVVQVVEHADDAEGRADLALVGKAVHAYAAAGVEQKAEKRVVDQPTGKVWGGAFDAAAHLSAPLAFRRELLAVTSRLCNAAEVAAVPVRTWEQVAGSWAHPLQFRRVYWALLFDFYRELSGARRGGLLTLSQAALTEVRALALCAPLLRSNLRAPLHGELFATDASDAWGAVVAARLPSTKLLELYREAETRGAYTRLDRAGEVVHGEAVRRLRPEVLPDIPEWPWKLLDRRPLTRARHINFKELHMQGFLWRRLARDGRWHGRRAAHLCDSEVAVAVRAKGRSASRALNAEALRQLPFIVGADSYPAPIWGPTQLMAADGPTRNRTIGEWRREARRCPLARRVEPARPGAPPGPPDTGRGAGGTGAGVNRAGPTTAGRARPGGCLRQPARR